MSKEINHILIKYGYPKTNNHYNTAQGVVNIAVNVQELLRSELDKPFLTLTKWDRGIQKNVKIIIPTRHIVEIQISTLDISNGLSIGGHPIAQNYLENVGNELVLLYSE